MRLTLREAASYFSVSERTVRRWLARRGLPVHRAHERMYCNPIELWEWALENGVPVSQRLLDDARRAPEEEPPPLSALLERGGCFRDVAGETKPEVLRELVKLLPLPGDVDRAFLATVLEAREAMGSTGIGDGIAIPHVRNPILLHIDEPFVSLFLLRHPIEFDAVDGQPVHALFVLVSSSVPAHLRILAQLGFVLRDEQLRWLLRESATCGAILDRIGALENRAASRRDTGDAAT
jgi:PTS system nitrogen regulatory IIA component